MLFLLMPKFHGTNILSPTHSSFSVCYNFQFTSIESNSARQDTFTKKVAQVVGLMHTGVIPTLTHFSLQWGMHTTAHRGPEVASPSENRSDYKVRFNCSPALDLLFVSASLMDSMSIHKARLL